MPCHEGNAWRGTVGLHCKGEAFPMVENGCLDPPTATPAPLHDCRVTFESMENLFHLWRDALRLKSLQWDCLFVTPVWLKVWWETFQRVPLPPVPVMWQGNELLGIAPLLLKEDGAALMGSEDVCDYLDIIPRAGREDILLRSLLRHLSEQGVQQLSLHPVRQDSHLVTSLGRLASSEGLSYSCVNEDVSVEMELPKTWDAFLEGLSSKERHEIRRKCRRLHRAGNVRFRVLEEPDVVGREMETFLHMFRMSRRDKAMFMNERMAEFFRRLVRELAALGMVKLMFLDVAGNAAAAVICFDDGTSMHLYNSGYDPAHVSLSVGLMSKVMSIRHAIQLGRKKYDFLKGAEPYKLRLGGRPVPICRCQVQLS